MSVGYVYVLKNPHGQRKVGFTGNLTKRSADVTPKLPWPVELEMTFCHPLANRIERISHKILDDVRGFGEWFSCDLDRIKHALGMAAVCAEYHKANPIRPKGLGRSKRSVPMDDGSRYATLRSRLELLCNERAEEERLSHSELARRMGFSPQKLHKLLMREIRIGFDEADAICTFFNVSIAWLSGESEIREPIPPELQVAIESMLRAGSHLRVVS